MRPLYKWLLGGDTPNATKEGTFIRSSYHLHSGNSLKPDRFQELASNDTWPLNGVTKIPPREGRGRDASVEMMPVRKEQNAG